MCGDVLQDDAPDLAAHHGVEAVDRLVEDQIIGLRTDGQPEGGLLLHALGEAAQRLFLVKLEDLAQLSIAAEVEAGIELLHQTRHLADRVARVGGETECVRMSCVQFLVNALLSAVGMVLFESPSWSAVASCWLPILHAGVLSGGVAFTLQIVGQQYTSPTLASMLLSLESVFAAIFGAILIPSQALQGRELFGCALMFAAIVLAQLPQRGAAKAAEAEQSTHR